MEPGPSREGVLRRVLAQTAHDLFIAPERIDPTDTVARVYDSLDETDLILKLEAEFGVSLPVESIAAYRVSRGGADMTFIDLAELVMQRWGTDPSATARRKCHACGYPMGEIRADVCPECGETRS